MPNRTAEEVFLERVRKIPRGDQGNIARRAGINGETFSNWRTGKVGPNPTLRTLVGLAAAMHCHIAHLVSDGPYEPAYDPDGVRRLLRAADVHLESSKELRAASIALVQNSSGSKGPRS